MSYKQIQFTAGTIVLILQVLYRELVIRFINDNTKI